MVKTKTFRKNRRNKRKTYSKKRRTNKCSLFKIGGIEKYITDEEKIIRDNDTVKLTLKSIFGLDKKELIELINKHKKDSKDIYRRGPWQKKPRPYSVGEYIEYYSFKKDAINHNDLRNDYVYNESIFINQNQNEPTDKPYWLKYAEIDKKFQAINLYTIVVLKDNYLFRSSYRIVIELDDDRNFCKLLNINQFLNLVNWINQEEEKKTKINDTKIDDINVNNNNNNNNNNI